MNETDKQDYTAVGTIAQEVTEVWRRGGWE